MSDAVVTAVREALAAGADPDRAAGQQRYMKSSMPYRGLTAPHLKAVLRPILADHRLDASAWHDTVLRLWREASYREERYAAIALLRHRYYQPWARDPEVLALLRYLIVTGAWWDLVDEIAVHCVGPVLRARPEQITPILRQWSGDSDLWIRRTVIICQLGAREETDTALLEHAISGSVGDRDFFARKAIGWALREYSKTDEDWVRGYVAAHPELSALSQREALKWLQHRRGASRHQS